MPYPRLLGRLLAFLPLLPPLLLGMLILRYSVNVPYNDDWVVLAPSLQHLGTGKLSLHDLLQQHNDSRNFFPKLIFLPLAYLTHWNVRCEMLVSFLLACLVFMNVSSLARQTVEGSTRLWLLLSFLAGLLIFSLAQWESWFWGIQLIAFLSIACITTSVRVASSRLRFAAKSVICALLATVSTFSFSNGILCWLVAFPVLALTIDSSDRKRRLTAGWMSGLALNAIVYFYGYHKPPYPPSLSLVITHPVRAIAYFLSFLGASFGWSTPFPPVWPAIGVGFLLVLLFGLALFYFARHAGQREIRARMAGWLAIGSYSILSAILATFGRLGFGIEQSLASRYTSYSIYLGVSLIFLAVIVYQDLVRRNVWGGRGQAVATHLAASLGAVLLSFHLFTSCLAFQQIRSLKVRLLAGKAALLFVNVLPDDALKQVWVQNRSRLQRFANSVDPLGLITPHLVRSTRIAELVSGSRTDCSNHGSFETLKISGSLCTAAGWTVLPDREEPAHAVLLTYETRHGDPVVFALASLLQCGPRPDVARALHRRQYANSGWQRTFSAAGLPAGPLKLRAWAFDACAGKAYPLEGVHCANGQHRSALLAALPPGPVGSRGQRTAHGTQHTASDRLSPLCAVRRAVRCALCAVRCALCAVRCPLLPTAYCLLASPRVSLPSALGIVPQRQASA